MGVAEPAPPALLVTAVTTNGRTPDREIHAALEETWGPVLGCLDPYRFEAFTHFYALEMGPELTKTICAFSRPFRPETLADAKITANKLEARWRRGAARDVNIDPGYLTPLNLVLASTKPAFHRVYLRNGVYAESTLKFVKGDYVTWDWTYPDYCQPALRAFLVSLRGRALDLFNSTEKHPRE